MDGCSKAIFPRTTENTVEAEGQLTGKSPVWMNRIAVSCLNHRSRLSCKYCVVGVPGIKSLVAVQAGLGGYVRVQGGY